MYDHEIANGGRYTLVIHLRIYLKKLQLMTTFGLDLFRRLESNILACHNYAHFWSIQIAYFNFMRSNYPIVVPSSIERTNISVK